MKKWKCTVCGYIHEGEEPPEVCPVCGADKSKFVLLEEESDAPAKAPAPPAAASAPEAEPAAEKKEAAPARESAAPKKAAFGKYQGAYDVATDQMIKYHAHPMSVHVPNGVLPVAFLFVLLAALFDLKGVGLASYYNLILVLLAMPLVIFTGLLEWSRRYKRALTSVFITKLTAASIVTLCVVVLTAWRVADPEVLVPGSSARGAYIFVWFVMIVATGVAGHMGGKLVFAGRKR